MYKYLYIFEYDVKDINNLILIRVLLLNILFESLCFFFFRNVNCVFLE